MSFRRFENSRNVKVLLSEIPSLLAHPCLFAVGSTITNYDRVGFPRLPLSSILLLVPSPSNRPLLKHFRSYRVDPGSFLRLNGAQEVESRATLSTVASTSAPV